jgi:hypothetical protein
MGGDSVASLPSMRWRVVHDEWMKKIPRIRKEIGL